MAKIVDQMGRERAALIAAESLTVLDPASNTWRKIIAGKPIPAGLEDVYAETIGAGKRKRK